MFYCEMGIGDKKKNPECMFWLQVSASLNTIPQYSRFLFKRQNFHPSLKHIYISIGRHYIVFQCFVN